MLGTSDSRASGRWFTKPAARPRLWAQARKENPLAAFIPFSSLVSDHDVITRGGDYLRVWRIDGVHFESADEHHVAERHEALCSLLRNLAGGQWAVWTHRIHRVVEDQLDDPSEPGFARDLSRAYQAKLGERQMMSNELFLTLVYRPNVSRISRALQPRQKTRAAIEQAQADALRVMEERSALVARVLRAFGPRPLGRRQHAGRAYSEVAEFLGYLVNGSWRAVPAAAGPLFRTLPMARLSFGGDKLELRHCDSRRPTVRDSTLSSWPTTSRYSRTPSTDRPRCSPRPSSPSSPHSFQRALATAAPSRRSPMKTACWSPSRAL